MLAEREVLSFREENNKLVGVALVYDTVSKYISEKGRRFQEIIRKGAIKFKDNISLVYRHLQPAEFADTESDTLKVWDDGKQILFEAELPRYAKKLKEEVKSGKLYGVSIAFNRDIVETVNGVDYVNSGRLEHIALTPTPAYGNTSVSIRETDSMQIRRRKFEWEQYI